MNGVEITDSTVCAKCGKPLGTAVKQLPRQFAADTAAGAGNQYSGTHKAISFGG